MKKKNIILALLLFLVIGFAAVTTTLYINGTISFAPNEDNFVVIFTYAELDEVDVSEEVISEDGKTITYTTNELSEVGDWSSLDFIVTNTSTMYDAEIEMECKAEGAHSDYYSIYNSIPEYVYASSVEEGYVFVELDKVSTEVIEETFTCTITAKAVERENEASELPDVYDLVWEKDSYIYGSGIFVLTGLDIIFDSREYERGDTINISGFPKGKHEVYYMGDMTKDEVEQMTYEEIKINAKATGSFVTEALRGYACGNVSLYDGNYWGVFQLYNPSYASCPQEQ